MLSAISYQLSAKNRGNTLIEVLISLGIFSLLTLAAAWLLVTTLRSNGIVWEQLQTSNDGRKALQHVVDDVRRAEFSSIGAYPIVTATTNTFTFYANIDTDSFREQVRFWLTSSTLKKGVTEPSGNPLQYNPANEVVVDVAHSIINATQNNPIFSYFGQSYTGIEPPLTSPVTTTDIRMVKIQLDIERDQQRSPAPLHVETTVQIRNLKTN